MGFLLFLIICIPMYHLVLGDYLYLYIYAKNKISREGFCDFLHRHIAWKSCICADLWCMERTVDIV